jgi:hypothetical protein
MTGILLVIGGSIFAILGIVHAAYTWADTRSPRRLVPDNPSVIEAMSASAVRLSRGGTTMWRAWIGFNFSHSQGDAAEAEHELLIPVAIGCVYLWLAIRFWFRIPALGIAAGTFCLAVAWMAY